MRTDEGDTISRLISRFKALLSNGQEKVRAIFKSQLMRNAAIYTISGTLTPAVNFLLMPVMLRFLSPEDYGMVSTFSTLEGMIIILAGLSMHNAVKVSFFQKTREELGVYVGNIFIILSISGLSMLLIMVIFGGVAGVWFKLPYFWLVLAVIVAVAEFVTTINLALWQAEQKAGYYAAYQFAIMLLNVSLALLLVVALRWGWIGRATGLAVTILTFGSLSLFILYKRGYFKFVFRRDYVSDILHFGVPLIPFALSGWILTGINILMVNKLAGLHSTGIYAIGYQIGIILDIMASAFYRAWTPYLFQNLKDATLDKKKKLVKITYGIAVSVLIGAFLVSLLGKVVLPYFTGESFRGSAEVLPWVALGAASDWMYYMVVDYLFYVKATKRLALVSIIVALLHVPLSYFFVKMNGAVGAAQAFAISYTLNFLAVWYLSSKAYEMPWRTAFNNEA